MIGLTVELSGEQVAIALAYDADELAYVLESLAEELDGDVGDVARAVVDHLSDEGVEMVRGFAVALAAALSIEETPA